MSFSLFTTPSGTNQVVQAMSDLDTMLLAAGFTVEATLGTPAAAFAKVYKSSTALNGVCDWYLYVARSGSTAGTFLTTIAENFNPANNEISGFPPKVNDVVPDQTTASSPLTQVLTAFADNNINHHTLSITVSNSPGNTYWFSVTPQRVVYGVRDTSNGDIGFYMGLFDSALTAALDPKPLILCGLKEVGSWLSTAASLVNSRTTREPVQASASAGNFVAGFVNQSDARAGFQGNVGGVDPYTTAFWIVRATLVTFRGNGLRGYLKDVFWRELGLGAVNGDTLTLTVNGVNRTLRFTSGRGTTTSGSAFWLDTSV